MLLRIWGHLALVGLLLLPGLGRAAENKPLSEIVRSVEQQGYVPSEVELEDGVWEIEATKDGKVFELTFDPKSGEALGAEEETEADDEDAEEEGEAEAREEEGEAVQTPLSALGGLIGRWVDEGGDAKITTTCAWTRHRHFMTRSFAVEAEGQVALEGTQVIAWDPVRQRIRSWMFDSEGGFGEGDWRQEGNRWIVKAAHTLAGGERASSINVLTQVDENTLRWKSINREIEGEMQPSIPEVTIVRQTAD